ncbi:MAG: hypothetical protein ACLFM3_09225, partial [Desulfohalobiaceae bacterium]
IMNKYPAALQLRYLQTMREMTYESKATTIIPIPLEAFKAFAGPQDGQESAAPSDEGQEESALEQAESRPSPDQE